MPTPYVWPLPPEPGAAAPAAAPASSPAGSTTARDLGFDFATGHFLRSAGDLQLVRGVEAIKQHARQRLQLFKGEWFLDADAGMDFWGTILIKNANPDLVRAEIEKAITGTPGILELQQLDLRFDSKTRTLTVSWRATTDTGELITDSSGIGVAASAA
jgi:hypothetical protein